MRSSPHRRFVRTLAVFGVVAILLSAIVSPPDPYTQFVYAGPLLLIALVLSVLRCTRTRSMRSSGTATSSRQYDFFIQIWK